MKKEMFGILIISGLIIYYLYSQRTQSLTPSLYEGVAIEGDYITDARGIVWKISQLTSGEIEKIKQGWTQGLFGQPAITPPGAIA